MEKLTSFIFKNSYWILGSIVILTAITALYIPFIKEDKNILAFLPKDDPDIKIFDETSRQFSALSVVLVGVESKKLFTYKGINELRKLQKEISHVDGVYNVFSFTEIPDPQIDVDGMSIQALIPDPFPQNKQEIENVRQKALNNAQIKERLISKDGNSALILVFLKDPFKAPETASLIKQKVLSLQPEIGLKTYFGGLPFIQYETGEGSKNDIINLSPYVIGVFVFLSLIFLRSWKNLLLSLSMVIITIVFTLGIMSMLKMPLTILSTSLPMILIATAGAYGGHILAGYYRQNQLLPLETKITNALKEVTPALLLSAFTTIIGFMSFIVMDVTPMKQFGIITATAIMLTVLLSIIMIPAYLYRFAPEVKNTSLMLFLTPFLEKLNDFLLKIRWILYAIVIILLLVVSPWIFKIDSDPTMRGIFRPESPIGRGESFLEKNFGGTLYMQIYTKGDMQNPATLMYLRNVVEYVKSFKEFSDVNSILDPIEIIAHGMGGEERIPRQKNQVQILIPFIADNPALKQLVNKNWTASLIQIRVKSVSGDRLRELVAQFKTYLNGLPDKIKLVDVGNFSEKELKQVDIKRQADTIERMKLLDKRNNLATNFEQLRNSITKSSINDNLSASETEFYIKNFNDFFNSPTSPWEIPEDFDQYIIKIPQLISASNRSVFYEKLKTILPQKFIEDSEGFELAKQPLWNLNIKLKGEIRANRIIKNTYSNLKNAKLTDDIKKILSELEDDYILISDKNGASIKSVLTGPVMMNLVSSRSTIYNQIVSIVFSFVLMTIFIILVFKKVKISVFSLLPTSMAILYVFAFMGLEDINMDLGTTMVASISLGMGIDYAIHFLWASKSRGNTSIVLAKVCPAIIFNALQVSLSFAVLIFAFTLPISNFGKLISLGFLLVGMFSIILLPTTILTKKNK